MVEYLISHKALPANLPKDLTLLRSSADMPRKLVPGEIYCHKCPGKVPLSDPIAISNKAKIVTVTEVVEVCDLQQPPPEFDGQVDVDDFWHSVSQEILCRGFVKSNAANPCVISPSYHKWAPWIGPHTRANNLLLNTEYQKGQCSKRANSAEQAEMDISEDRLINEIINLKVDAVRKLAKQCGLESTGSKMDLVIRLKEQMKSRSAFDKVFSKVWGASGGWAVIMCPCGIVNSMKFNVRAESPRDYCDMLLSFKHFPNVVIYDFARGLATHTNLREPLKIPFMPNEGRLADATPEHLQSAQKGDLKVNLPWLKVQKERADSNAHPSTGSAEHYALYDTFHEANTREVKDCLRKISLVPELHGSVNSQVAEQLFSKMRKNNYFLNMMSPGSHIFLMRAIIHHHNTMLNENTLGDIHKISSADITLDSSGKAVMGS
nr:HMG domain-containing protein 3-like [Nothobranchius furzeri]XP_054592254.1 HMG domain-containing protein 3-like [Nothobranchius furzeri]